MRNSTAFLSDLDCMVVSVVSQWFFSFQNFEGKINWMRGGIPEIRKILWVSINLEVFQAF